MAGESLYRGADKESLSLSPTASARSSCLSRHRSFSSLHNTSAMATHTSSTSAYVLRQGRVAMCAEITPLAYHWQPPAPSATPTWHLCGHPLYFRGNVDSWSFSLSIPLSPPTVLLFRAAVGERHPYFALVFNVLAHVAMHGDEWGVNLRRGPSHILRTVQILTALLKFRNWVGKRRRTSEIGGIDCLPDYNVCYSTFIQRTAV